MSLVTDIENINLLIEEVKAEGMSPSLENFISSEENLSQLARCDLADNCLKDLKSVSNNLNSLNLEIDIIKDQQRFFIKNKVQKNHIFNYINKDENNLFFQIVEQSFDSNITILKEDSGYVIKSLRDIEADETLSLNFNTISPDIIKECFGVSTESISVVSKLDLQAGDIIIFSEFTKFKKLANVFTVLLTRSIFTHVGIVVKNQNKLWMFDATMDNGVKLTSVLKYGLNEKYICVRRCSTPEMFNCEKNKDTKDFIKKYLGAEFASFTKFTRAIFGNTIVLGNRKVSPNKVFCSELLAMLLQSHGLLSLSNMKRSSATFTPKMFFSLKITNFKKPLFLRGKGILISKYDSKG